MWRIIFDITRFQTKIFIAMMLISLFSVCYMIIPRNEFHKVEHYHPIDNSVTYFDILQYSLLSQVGIHGPVLYPKSVRAKILTFTQLFLGYAVLLM